MPFSPILPNDGAIAALLGLARFWEEIVPYLDHLGFLIWYAAGAIFMLMAMLLPRGPFVSPLIAALATGVILKLADVYSWGRIAYSIQILAFLALLLMIAGVRSILRRRRRGIVFSK